MIFQLRNIHLVQGSPSLPWFSTGAGVPGFHLGCEPHRCRHRDGESMALWCSQWEARHRFFFGQDLGHRLDHELIELSTTLVCFGMPLCYNRGCTRTSFLPFQGHKNKQGKRKCGWGQGMQDSCKICRDMSFLWGLRVATLIDAENSMVCLGTVPDLISVRFLMVSSLFFCIIENNFIDPSEAEKTLSRHSDGHLLVIAASVSSPHLSRIGILEHIYKLI